MLRTTSCWALLVLLVGVSTVSADTMVGGLIGADTHWTVDNGPYVVATNIVVYNSATLTIDPGVEVRFDPSTKLDVEVGQLIAQGTAADTIRFTVNLPGDINRWSGIEFSDGAVDANFDHNGNYVGGSIIEYGVVEYAKSVAIVADKCSPYIANSIIQNNGWGISATGADGLHVVGNTITGNMAGGNARGIWLGESDNVSLNGNTISHNSGTGIYTTGTDDLRIVDCIIEKNSGTGILVSYSEKVALSGNRIIDNSASGISYRQGYSIVLSSDPAHPTWIFGNGNYQAYNQDSFQSWDPAGRGNIDARNVWWGTTDLLEIEQGIYHYVDDSNLGVVFYQPFAPVPEPSTLILLGMGAVGLLAYAWRRRAQTCT